MEKTGFLRIDKSCEALKMLTNRQKQFFLCLLYLSRGGKQDISNKMTRAKTQRLLGLDMKKGWSAYFKMIRILKAKKLIIQRKDTSGKFLSYEKMYLGGNTWTVSPDNLI